MLQTGLFNLYSAMIMRSLQNIPGVSVDGHSVNDQRYADDTMLKMQRCYKKKMVKIITRKSQNKGLSLSSRKAEVMVIHHHHETFESLLPLRADI